jgi:Arc/MetJ-type ribon-helix-helix transcriptional regulator
MTQRPLAVRLPEETVDGLDRLVAEGWYVTRSSCIKDALDQLLAAFERKRIDDAILAGYERMPLTDDEIEWSERSAQEMFDRWAAEPEEW